MNNLTMSKSTLMVIIIIWTFTLIRSIIIMFGKKVFKDSSINEKSASIPILNLFSMLEVLDISTYLGILLFIPIVNLFVLMLMSIKLGQKYDCDILLQMGLILLPPVFYFVLFNNNKTINKETSDTFYALDSAKSESINLMTEEEIKKENDSPYDLDPAVDSIFKSELDLIEPAETYRATRLDQDVLDKLKDLSNSEENNKQVNSEENVSYFDLNEDKKTDINDNSLIKEIKNEEEIEFIDL